MNAAQAASFPRVASQETLRVIPWQILVKLAGVACLPLGLVWDISWHMSIGRDTFWTPAHITIQLGGILPALMFAFQAWRKTFVEPPAARADQVRVWGGYCSFGGWVTMWGATSMLLSAPFDDWWHNTYGLDVKIVSPPHAVLGLGMFAVMLGVLLDLLRAQNSAAPATQKSLATIFTICSGLVITMLSVYATEYTWPNRQHSANFYQVISTLYPFLLILAAGASRLRWGATMACSVYLLCMLAQLWILPLFPAQAKLAPIYNPISSMVPLPFPLLLIVPALGIDVIMRWRRSHLPMKYGWLKDFGFAILIGSIFLLLALPAQWKFSEFLLSAMADNWFFAGGHNWPYYVDRGPWSNQFWREGGALRPASIAIALALAFVSARAGLVTAAWMTRVRR